MEKHMLGFCVNNSSILSSGVARSLLLGGQGASVGKIFGDHALETLGKQGKRSFQLCFAS